MQRTYYPEGQFDVNCEAIKLKEEYTIINGKLHGDFKMWYDNGQFGVNCEAIKPGKNVLILMIN